MKLHKIISFILAGATVLSLAACGNGKHAEENAETVESTGVRSEATEAVRYVFSDNRIAMLSDEDVKFSEQEADFVKVYDKADLKEGGTQIVIDPSITYQTIEGFGASMTDASVYLLMQMPEEEMNDVLVKLFDPEKGIGASIIRNPVGCCDFSFVNYTYDDMPAGEEDWELEHFDASRAQDQIDMVHRAKAINPDIKLILSPWTAPPWMKTGQDYTGSDGGKLRRECYDVYADYLAKCVQVYEDAGLPVYALTPQNEMFLPARWAGMTWDWESMSNFVNDDLRPALTEAGLTTKILNMDHNWAYSEEANMIMSATYETADGIAYHWYSGEPEVMKESAELFPDKLIYMTEGTGTKPENMTRFLKLTSMMARSLYSNANAYLVWNYVLRPEGGPYEAPLEKYPDLIQGASTNSPFVYYNDTTGELNYGYDYYALAHFSKYIHVGAVRVDSTDTGADSNYKLCNVVVVNPNGTMTAVIVNAEKEDVVCKMVMGEQVMEVNAPAKSTITITWEAEIQ